MSKEQLGGAIIGNNALQLEAWSTPQVLKKGQLIDLDKHRKSVGLRREMQAFRHEFYQTASDKQVENDIISYLGEYRFEVSEFDYKLGITEGKLIDPASGELMTLKAKKAIQERRRNGLNYSREEAELDGLFSLEKQVAENPKGTIVWFSPPGDKEEGYGEYGFGYVGRMSGSEIKMTAIRLENPQIPDFNVAASALWGVENYETAEDFLRSPRVIDINNNKVREFIHGFFEIKNAETKQIFEKVRLNLEGVIAEYLQVVRGGTEEQKHIAFHVVENLSLELRSKYQQQMDTGNIIFFADYKLPELFVAMGLQKYNTPPPVVRGSCGISGKKESNDIFRNLDTSLRSVSRERNFKFDQPGPCRVCGENVPCGPCKICESCNDKIDEGEQTAA